MQTEPNNGDFKNDSNNSLLLNQNFIVYINTLSDSIKEFCKVSKNANKNKNMLIYLSDLEINNAENILKEINKNEVKNNNKINSMNVIIEELKDILFKFKTNFLSEENNLQNFFEDVKVLFKKMKEKRNEVIANNIKNSSNSSSKRRNISIYAPSQSNAYAPLKKKDIISYNRNTSEINDNTKNKIISLSSFSQRLDNDNKNVRYNKTRYINYGIGRKARTVNKTRYTSSDEPKSIFENNSYSLSNPRKKSAGNIIIDSKSQNLEIQKLKLLNKKLSNELKHCKSKILKRDNNALEDSIKNSSNNLEKDKIILSLQKEIIQNDKNSIELINICNNYKSRINELTDENKKLKQINLLIKKKSSDEITNTNNNDNKDIDYNKFSLKINNLVKENKRLKNNIDELKLKNYNSSKSEFNCQSVGDFNLNNNNIYENEMQKKN